MAARLTPTYGWDDLPDYKGWVPGEQGAPQRASLLEAGIEGERLVLTGRVLTRDAAPMANVKLDFWQADSDGHYDRPKGRMSYRLRGIQRTNADGEYRLETIMPGAVDEIRHINYIASARIPGRKQDLNIRAAIYFASDRELDAPVRPAERAYVLPGARRHRDDPAYQPLSSLRRIDGILHASYDIVFDVN